MKHWALTLYCTVEGVSSVSGLHWQTPHLYLIADNSSYLYQYDIEHDQLHHIALTDDAQDRIAKPLKYDLESLLFESDTLHLFGSGSKPTRLQQFSYDLKNAQVNHHDLSLLYTRFRQIAGLAEDELNIEGVVSIAKPPVQWWFFQRGNGAQGCNGIFIVAGEQFERSTDIRFINVTLPAINHCATSFTDAVLVDDTIYFLAAAENADSTYDDGEVMGSLLGWLNIKDQTIESVIQISDQHKFEGITLLSQSDQEMAFLLGEDNDQHDASTTVYKLVIQH